MDMRGINYIASPPQNQQIAPCGSSKRKQCDCKGAIDGLYYREQPIRDGKKRFWIDLFYEKTGVVLGEGTKKVCYVVKQDHIEFALLKSKIDIRTEKGAMYLASIYQEREIQMHLSKYGEKYVQIIDSFLLPSRKNPNIIKWYTLAEKFEGDLTTIRFPHHIDSYIMQLALRMQEIIRENIIIPDFKLDNVLFRGDLAFVTDYGSAHFVDMKPFVINMTMAYMSPERSLYVDGGFPGMIYALGVCIAQLAYHGKVPFPNDKLEKNSHLTVTDYNRAEYIKSIQLWQKKLRSNKFKPLIIEMTAIKPEARPHIDEVVNKIHLILSNAN